MRHSVRSALLPLLAVGVFSQLLTPARADEQLEKAKKAYSGLLEQAKEQKLDKPAEETIGKRERNGWGKVEIDGKQIDVWKGPAARIKPVPSEGGGSGGGGGGGDTQLCVKVWAELSDLAGTHSGQFVNVQLYKWKPKQRFYLWLESPVPVQLSMVQYYDVGPAEAKDPRLVLPDKNFPNSFATVCPGKPFAFPQLLEMDNNLREEFVTVTIVVAGAPISTPMPGGDNTPTPPPTPINNPGVNVLNQMQINNTTNIFAALNQGPVERNPNNKMLLFKDKKQDLRRMGAVNPDLPAGTDGSSLVSPDANKVAMFALGTQTIGHLPLRFSK